MKIVLYHTVTKMFLNVPSTCQTFIPIGTLPRPAGVATKGVLSPAVQPPVGLVVHEEVPVLVRQVAPDGPLLRVVGVGSHTFLGQYTHIYL